MKKLLRIGCVAFSLTFILAFWVNVGMAQTEWEKNPGYSDCWDVDEDGYEDEVCGGLDCDDSDPLTYPGAEEICDREDNDCNGVIPFVELVRPSR